MFIVRVDDAVECASQAACCCCNGQQLLMDYVVDLK